jgi:hypothetical protein
MGSKYNAVDFFFFFSVESLHVHKDRRMQPTAKSTAIELLAEKIIKLSTFKFIAKSTAIKLLADKISKSSTFKFSTETMPISLRHFRQTARARGPACGPGPSSSGAKARLCTLFKGCSWPPAALH